MFDPQSPTLDPNFFKVNFPQEGRWPILPEALPYFATRDNDSQCALVRSAFA
jgi:hypothetical protein